MVGERGEAETLVLETPHEGGPARVDGWEKRLGGKALKGFGREGG